MDRAEILRFDHVSYIYEEEEASAVKAVDDLSFSVKEGEFLAVLGHNGSGKSTVARLANGLYLPTEGKVFAADMDTADPACEIDVRKTVGVVFQNPDNQIVASIVEEDVAFGPENLNLPQKEIRRRVDAALDAVGMTEYAGHETHRLSGGQKQRVAIAGIIAMRPRCLVLDEPTAMLDPRGRADVMKTLISLNRDLGIAVVLITHFMDEAAGADRVLLMKNGRRAALETPDRIFSEPGRLTACGLELPDAAKLCDCLRKRGVKVPPEVYREEQLLAYLFKRLPER